MTYRAYVKEVIAYLTDRMNLHEWQITLVFDKELSDNAAAQCGVDDTYFAATITLDPHCRWLYEQGRVADLCDILCHEMSHIIINPVYFLCLDGLSEQTKPFAKQKMEQATQRLTMILMKDIPARFKRLKK